VLDEKTEREMFPELTGGSQSDQAAAVAEAAGNAQTMQNIMQEAALGRGSDPLGNEQMIDAVRRTYRPPWELGLQKWLESMTPTERSYARPSRRGADRVDVVLPGRKREGWTVHIVLDTSGSMTQEIPEALGAIAVFCEAMNVEEIHLIQCDAAIQEDEVLSPSQLSRWKVTGYGGSDLNPAMERLAERADVEAVIVLTDGDIAYPQESQPYQVLWVLPARVPLMSFRPPYGKVVSMNRNETR
jgi:predicted metal-dependent peptidase